MYLNTNIFPKAQYYSNTVNCFLGIREIMIQDLAYYTCTNHDIYNKIKHISPINKNNFNKYKNIFDNHLKEYHLNKDKYSLLKESIPEVYQKMETNQ